MNLNAFAAAMPNAPVFQTQAAVASQRNLLLWMERQCAQYFTYRPEFAQTAKNILSSTGYSNRGAMVVALNNWVKSHLAFAYAEQAAGQITSPVVLLSAILRNGWAYGTSDDHVMLFNTFLGSVGISARFVGVKLGGSTTYNHVVSGVLINNGMVLVETVSGFPQKSSYGDYLTGS